MVQGNLLMRSQHDGGWIRSSVLSIDCYVPTSLPSDGVAGGPICDAPLRQSLPQGERISLNGRFNVQHARGVMGMQG